MLNDELFVKKIENAR